MNGHAVVSTVVQRRDDAPRASPNAAGPHRLDGGASGGSSAREIDMKALWKVLRMPGAETRGVPRRKSRPFDWVFVTTAIGERPTATPRAGLRRRGERRRSRARARMAAGCGDP